MNVEDIPLSKVRLARDVRGKVDVEDLVEGFQAVGQLHPILVVQQDDGTYDVYAGHRRVRAARKLKWKTIAAVLHDGDGDTADEKAIYENLSRRDLTFKQQAREVARLKEIHIALGHPRARFTEALSAATGMSKRKVQRLARLGKAEEEVLDAVDAGKLKVHEAEKLADAPTEEQRAAAAAAHRADTRDEPKPIRVELTADEHAALGRAVAKILDEEWYAFSDHGWDNEERWLQIQRKLKS